MWSIKKHFKAFKALKINSVTKAKGTVFV